MLLGNLESKLRLETKNLHQTNLLFSLASFSNATLYSQESRYLDLDLEWWLAFHHIHAV